MDLKVAAVVVLALDEANCGKQITQSALIVAGENLQAEELTIGSNARNGPLMGLVYKIRGLIRSKERRSHAELFYPLGNRLL